MCTSHYLDLFITGVIGLNVITMAMEHYQQPKVLGQRGGDRRGGDMLRRGGVCGWAELRAVWLLDVRAPVHPLPCAVCPPDSCLPAPPVASGTWIPLLPTLLVKGKWTALKMRVGAGWFGLLDKTLIEIFHLPFFPHPTPP